MQKLIDFTVFLMRVSFWYRLFVLRKFHCICYTGNVYVKKYVYMNFGVVPVQ